MVHNLIVFIVFSLGTLIFLEFNRRYLFLSFLLTVLVAMSFNYFAHTQGWPIFMFIKTYSVIIPIILLSFFQLCHSSNKKISQMIANIGRKYIIPFLLIINIGEAIWIDFLYANLFNSFIGVVLLGTMPIGKEWRYDENNILGFTKQAAWPILYTIWNISFLLTNFLVIRINSGLFTALLILFLTLAYVAYYKQWHLWFMARAFSLYLFCIQGSFYPDLFLSRGFSGINEPFNMLLHVLSIISVVYLVYVYYKNKICCLFLT